MQSYNHKKKTFSINTRRRQVAYFLFKKILAQPGNKNMLKIKTGGQTVVFQRIQKPRVSSDKVSSPIKRMRTKNLGKI